jgi:endonuclease-3
MNNTKRRAIFEQLRAANPSPATELNYTNPFQLLVAVMLSAQATDKGVNRATRKLFEIIERPTDVVALGEARLKTYIKRIGLFNIKAKNIVQASKILLEEHDGKVPDDRQKLEGLPGVGRKTANVVLNTAFGRPTIAVDTHIFRVANRTGLAPGRNVREVENKLEKTLPPEFKQDAHHWLILLGRYTCVARTPKCPQCVIHTLCEFRHKTAA